MKSCKICGASNPHLIHEPIVMSDCSVVQMPYIQCKEFTCRRAVCGRNVMEAIKEWNRVNK